MVKKRHRRSDASNKYAWTIYDSNELKLWPSGNKIIYFMHKNRGEVLPLNALDRDENLLKMPPPSTPDLWSKYSIPLLGYAEHTKGYYHSRINKSFYDMLIVEKGLLDVKFDGKKAELKRGDALILPRGNLCDNFVKNMNTCVWWIHFSNVPYWSEILGPKTCVRTLKSFKVISALMRTYLEELYYKDSYKGILERLASSIVAALRREFDSRRPCENDECAILRLMKKISENPCADWNIKKQSRLLSISEYVINGYCIRHFGRSYSKYLLDRRMERAVELIREGKHTNAEIANIIGYANAYSFSKAVFSYYGKYPRALRKELNDY